MREDQQADGSKQPAVNPQTGEARTAIEFFTTEELIAELSKRSDSIVLGLVPLVDSGIQTHHLNGRRATCLGLITELNMKLRTEARRAWKNSL